MDKNTYLYLPLIPQTYSVPPKELPESGTLASLVLYSGLVLAATGLVITAAGLVTLLSSTFSDDVVDLVNALIVCNGVASALAHGSLQLRHRFGLGLLNNSRSLAVVGDELFVCDTGSDRLHVFWRDKVTLSQPRVGAGA